MLERKKVQSLDDYFTELNDRRDRGVYFCRINGYSENIDRFIKKFYDTALKNGIVIEGKIPNPDGKNLSYYTEMMGMDFALNVSFISDSLKRWLPRMRDKERQAVAESVYASLLKLQQAGKNDNILRNVYIKFMCWLYYKFERIVNRLGDNILPKILYEGEVSSHELMLLSVLSNAGCDIVLLQYRGDENYRKTDSTGLYSDEYKENGESSFPKDFSLKKIRDSLRKASNDERLYGTLPLLANCTNAWISGKGLEDIRTAVNLRGEDSRFFYNCFCRVNGAADRLMYAGELLELYQELKRSKRNIVVADEGIPLPTPEEISSIKRNRYADAEQLIMDLALNIGYSANAELGRIIRKAFVEIILEEAELTGDNLNKLTNKAVYLLCYIKRYYLKLFAGWKQPDIACFIYLGGCKNDNEAMLMRLLARLPVDVLILCPDLNTKCCLKDIRLYEINYPESLHMDRFPLEAANVKIGTAAFHAERDLDEMLYQNTGLYRNKQYGSANTINLCTMYEEIPILWDEELKYRPNFSTADGQVNIPVIFAKVSGVKDGKTEQYWEFIKNLLTEDTLLIKGAPYIEPLAPNPMKHYSVEFFKNGRLLRDKIINHSQYPYGILRREMQDFMLDKLELLIGQKRIRGIGENGMEYTVIAQVLNLPKNIVRQIQKFDFTKKNPKLVYINTTETVISLEDSILTAFLNLLGFDILFFIPTGYQCIEKHFSDFLPEEHQIGEYVYDMRIPDFNTVSSKHSQFNLKNIIENFL